MALINLRNAMMAGKRLPYDAEVEYLERNDSEGQYVNVIDTGVVLNRNYKIAGKHQTISVRNWGRGGFDNTGSVGGGTQSNVNVVRFMRDTSGSKFSAEWFASTNTSKYNIPSGFFDILQYEGDKTGWLINGSGYSAVSDNNGTDSNLPLLLMTFSVDSDTGLSRGKMWWFKIWDDNGTLVRDFIPVRKGTVGYLYDRVSGKLFGNAGTGDFVLGPDVVPVEYIESHGTEYIDTGIHNDTNVKMNFKVKPSSKSGLYFMGVDGGIIFGTNNGVNFRANGVNSINAFDTNTFYTIEMYYNGNQRFCVIDGGETLSNTVLSMLDKNMFLFAASGGGSAPVYYLPWSISGCKMWNNDTLVRSFRPVRVGTDATSWEGAMMDVLTRRIYRNAGTGAFTYGNDLKYPIPAT